MARFSNVHGFQPIRKNTPTPLSRPIYTKKMPEPVFTPQYTYQPTYVQNDTPGLLNALNDLFKTIGGLFKPKPKDPTPNNNGGSGNSTHIEEHPNNNGGGDGNSTHIEEHPNNNGGGGDHPEIKQKEMVCEDMSGITDNIQGEYIASDDSKTPETIEITDTSSGSPHKYTYQKTDRKDEKGHPVYELVSTYLEPNIAAGKRAEYSLLWLSEDGSESESGEVPKFEQYANQQNHGSGATRWTPEQTQAFKKFTPDIQSKLRNNKALRESLFRELGHAPSLCGNVAKADLSSMEKTGDNYTKTIGGCTATYDSNGKLLTIKVDGQELKLK